MREAHVPKDDRFQVITEHAPTDLIIDPTYLGIARSTDRLIVQITLNEGRTLVQKRALYQSIADGLHDRLAMRRGTSRFSGPASGVAGDRRDDLPAWSDRSGRDERNAGSSANGSVARSTTGTERRLRWRARQPASKPACARYLRTPDRQAP
ncbi:MAG: tautomerase family protein [Caldimonas sp.]